MPVRNVTFHALPGESRDHTVSIATPWARDVVGWEKSGTETCVSLMEFGPRGALKWSLDMSPVELADFIDQLRWALRAAQALYGSRVFQSGDRVRVSGCEPSREHVVRPLVGQTGTVVSMEPTGRTCVVVLDRDAPEDVLEKIRNGEIYPGVMELRKLEVGVEVAQRELDWADETETEKEPTQ